MSITCRFGHLEVNRDKCGLICQSEFNGSLKYESSDSREIHHDEKGVDLFEYRSQKALKIVSCKRSEIFATKWNYVQTGSPAR